jgi:hypothetical protein
MTLRRRVKTALRLMQWYLKTRNDFSVVFTGNQISMVWSVLYCFVEGIKVPFLFPRALRPQLLLFSDSTSKKNSKFFSEDFAPRNLHTSDGCQANVYFCLCHVCSYCIVGQSVPRYSSPRNYGPKYLRLVCVYKRCWITLHHDQAFYTTMP